MRLLLLADVHANWLALLSLQRAERRPDAVLFAGDAVGYGPDPAACANWLAANAPYAVRGNHDQALNGPLTGAPPELAEAGEETLELARRAVTPDDRATVLNWPLTRQVSLGGATFFLAHGTPHAPLDGEIDIATARPAQLEAALDGVSADVVVLGHTHVPALRQIGRQIIVNPGSLGQPRYGVPDATYAVWDDGRLQIHHLHYDHHAALARLALAPLSPETVERLQEILHSGLVS